MGEAYLPNNADFPWTLDYTQFNLSPCLSVSTFLILSLCLSTLCFFRNMILACWPHLYQMYIAKQINVKKIAFGNKEHTTD